MFMEQGGMGEYIRPLTNFPYRFLCTRLLVWEHAHVRHCGCRPGTECRARIIRSVILAVTGWDFPSYHSV